MVDNARRQRALHFEIARGPKKDVKQIKIARDAIKIQRDDEIARQTRSSSYPTIPDALNSLRASGTDNRLGSAIDPAGYDASTKVQCKKRNVLSTHRVSRCTPSYIEMAERY